MKYLSNLVVFLVKFYAVFCYSKPIPGSGSWFVDSERSISSSLSLQCPERPSDTIPCTLLSPMSKLLYHDSVKEANLWIALISSHCHPKLKEFVCSFYNPVCLQSHQIIPIQPCREFCLDVYSQCMSKMSHFGFKWPEYVNCGRFSEKEDSMCISSERESEVVCTPCQQEMTHVKILGKYCQADVVIKAAIANVAILGNTSILHVLFENGAEVIHPQKDDPAHWSKLARRSGISSNGFLDMTYDPLQQETLKRKKKNFDNPTRVENKFQNGWSSFHSSTTWSDSQAKYIHNSSQSGRVYDSGSNRRRMRVADFGRGRRERRSNYRTSTGFLKSMLLLCAGCPLLEMSAYNSKVNQTNYWLVMAKYVLQSADAVAGSSHMLQITSIMPWSKESADFRKSVRTIRTVPRETVCASLAQFQQSYAPHNRQEFPPSAYPRLKRLNGSIIEEVQSKKQAYNLNTKNRILYASDDRMNENVETLIEKETKISPAQFSKIPSRKRNPIGSFTIDRFLQNDASSINVKNRTRQLNDKERKERRKRRNMFRERDLVNSNRSHPIGESHLFVKWHTQPQKYQQNQTPSKSSWKQVPSPLTKQERRMRRKELRRLRDNKRNDIERRIWQNGLNASIPRTMEIL